MPQSIHHACEWAPTLWWSPLRCGGRGRDASPQPYPYACSIRMEQTQSRLQSDLMVKEGVYNNIIIIIILQYSDIVEDTHFKHYKIIVNALTA